MSDRTTGDPAPDGEFDAELSDTHASIAPPAVGGASGEGPIGRAPAPFARRRTPRQQLLRLVGIVAMVLLTLLIIVGGTPGLRDRAVGLVFPPPTPTLVPGTDEFTFLPNPPGVTVSLDGHTLAHPPLAGDPHPLRLAPGQHTFAWRSRSYPFVPQSCLASVPPAPGDTCTFVDSDALIAQGVLSPSNVLAMHADLFSLRPDLIASLQITIQAALAASTSIATVLPGEPYYSTQPSGAGGYTMATQLLRATYALAPFAASGTDPCILPPQPISCPFHGQNCTALCTIADPPPGATAGAPDAWIAAAPVNTTWTYTAANGEQQESNSGPSNGIAFTILRITWDGTLWHVTPILGHTPGLPTADNVACNDAQFWLSNSTWGFMLNNPPPGGAVDFVSDATPADGCLVIISRGPSSATTALFLERFGLLLTLNDTARNPLDGFRQADAAEQQIAQVLAAQAGVSLLGQRESSTVAP